jgi:Fe2+ or Zn2+ uptake regulation protein
MVPDTPAGPVRATRQRGAIVAALDESTEFRSAQDLHSLLRGRAVEVEGPAVERWADRVAAEHGFSEVEHTVEVFGTCARCG